MSVDSILQQIDSEIARLTQARALLSGVGKASARAAVASKAAPAKPANRRRALSAEARKRIADAQRKRWAAQKAKSKAK